MALVGPGAMTEYTGGPRQSRRRGFVSVNEPAQGFFIAGSSIDSMNGVYGRVNTDGIWSQHTILLAYRSDNHMKWIMALVERTQSIMQRKNRFRHFRRQTRLHDSSSSESEEEVEEEMREWLFIDPDGRDRLMHDGDTIIPGSGVSWKHVHRGTPQVGRNVRYSQSTALQAQEADDEDELPWQVIAILDRQTMRDMRYTQRCYEANIQNAMSGKNLPKPALAGIDDSTHGCWLFKVVAPKGIEVYIEPSSRSPLVGHRETGEHVQGVERRDNWLKITSSVGSVDLDDCRLDDLWVQIESLDGVVFLASIAEEDMPNLEAEPLDQPEADIFDRPFEPRLEDPNAKEEQVEDQDVEEDDDVVIPSVDASESVSVTLPARDVELAIGIEVSLEGLNKEHFNGSCATVVTRMTEDRRQGVRLKRNGQKISVKACNLRPILDGENGELGRHARVLGLSLKSLCLENDVRDGVAESQRLVAQQLLGAAFRATERDLVTCSDGARRDAEVAHEALASALATLTVSAITPKAEKACDRKSVDSAATTAASNSDAPSALEESLPDTTSPLKMPIAPGKAPHEIVESGELGARGADAARLANCSNSALSVDRGVIALRELLVEEQSRIRKSFLGRVHAPPDNLQDVGEGPDALRLRLTLVRALLRGRREVEAGKEAGLARRLHPASSAAALWCGRCLLRLGGGSTPREEALRLLSLAASEASGVDGLWAATEAKKRLVAARRADRAELKAKDAYARGLFTDAVKQYTEAIENADALGDDKWLRAELRSNRASCHRRARELRAAIADLDVALSFFPRYKRALFRRGVCLLEIGCPKDAIISMETLLGLDREWPNLLDWLVRAHALQKRQGAGAVSFNHESYSAPSAGTPSFTEGGGWAEAAAEKDIATEKNHYTVLGVSTDATEKQLKRAYRVMSLKFHPDKEGGSTRAFQRIATAYQTLSDPEKRQLYDEGADLKQHGNNSDSDSDNERETKSLREEIERKYFPERYKFWPFGDPFVQKRKRQEKQRARSGKPAFHEEDI